MIKLESYKKLKYRHNSYWLFYVVELIENEDRPKESRVKKRKIIK